MCTQVGVRLSYFPCKLGFIPVGVRAASGGFVDQFSGKKNRRGGQCIRRGTEGISHIRCDFESNKGGLLKVIKGDK